MSAARASALLVVAAFACEPPPPDEAWARATYRTLRSRIDRVDRALRRGAETFEPLRIEPLDPSAILGQGADVPFGTFRRATAAMEAQDRAERALETARARFVYDHVRPLEDVRGLVDLDVDWMDLSDPARPVRSLDPHEGPSAQDGTVRAAHGISVDGRRIGWGTFRPLEAPSRAALEVGWEFETRRARFEVSLVISPSS